MMKPGRHDIRHQVLITGTELDEVLRDGLGCQTLILLGQELRQCHDDRRSRHRSASRRARSLNVAAIGVSADTVEGPMRYC